MNGTVERVKDTRRTINFLEVSGLDTDFHPFILSFGIVRRQSSKLTENEKR